VNATHGRIANPPEDHRRHRSTATPPQTFSMKAGWQGHGMEYVGNAAQFADSGVPPRAEEDPRKVGAQRPRRPGTLGSAGAKGPAGNGDGGCRCLSLYRRVGAEWGGAEVILGPAWVLLRLRYRLGKILFFLALRPCVWRSSEDPQKCLAVVVLVVVENHLVDKKFK